MSTNIQVPNYPNYQQSQQGVQSVQPNHMGGNYNPQQQNTQPVAQQVHYDNYNQVIPVVVPVDENTSKSVTFIADAISLDVMKDCDNIHINTLINMGIRLAKEHSFYKQFLVNKENYNLKETNINYDDNSTTITHIQNNTPLNTQPSPAANIIPTTTAHTTSHTTSPAINNDLDFSKMFNN